MPELHHDYHPPNIDRLRKFDSLVGLEIDDPQKRIDAFKNLDPQQFLDLLSISNGLLRDTDKFQRWDGKVKGAILALNGMDPEVHPPDNANEQFMDIFKELQSKLKDESGSIDKVAVQLYFAIVGSHLFPDGNGRTARAAFHLLRNGKLPDDEKILDRSSAKTSKICIQVNTGAVVELLIESGLPKDRVFERKFVAADNSDGFVTTYGLSQHLKYIAARKLMNDENPADVSKPPDKIILSEQTSFVQTHFASEFQKVRKDWLNKFVDIPGRHVDVCIQDIEGPPVSQKAVA